MFQNRILELYVCDTTGEDDLYINEYLVHQGVAIFKNKVNNSNSVPYADNKNNKLTPKQMLTVVRNMAKNINSLQTE